LLTPVLSTTASAAFPNNPDVIIIIIIKKVKIIVTLSIKNTAGALFKSQIKGENRYCLWLRNSNVLGGDGNRAVTARP